MANIHVINCNYHYYIYILLLAMYNMVNAIYLLFHVNLYHILTSCYLLLLALSLLHRHRGLPKLQTPITLSDMV